MLCSKKWMGSAVLCGLALAFAFLPEYAASRSRESRGRPQSGAQEPVPAYHDQVPQGALAATMSPEFFTGPGVQNAYTVAARIKKTLYQQPCYCHCDRSLGHGSLLDCFASKHGSGCNICMSEDFYAYEQLRKGKTASQIRAGIIRGDWQSVDLAKYQASLPAK
jgi:uncharacterized protein with PCYCGC motif